MLSTKKRKTINTLVPAIHPWLVSPWIGGKRDANSGTKEGTCYTATPQNEPRAAQRKIIKKPETYGMEQL